MTQLNMALNHFVAVIGKVRFVAAVELKDWNEEIMDLIPAGC